MRGNAARALLPALAVLALVGVVAIAATGSTEAGSADSRAPSEALLDSVFSVALLLLIPALAIVVYGLMQRKAIGREMASGRYHRTGLLTWLGFVAIFGLVFYYRLRGWERPVLADDLERAFPGARPGTPRPGAETTTYEPELAVLPMLVVAGLAVIAIVAAYLALRRRPSPLSEESVSEALDEVLRETLADLRAEADPRKAVIAAYARLERALAGVGLPRRPAETPEELLARVLGALDVDERAIRRLTELFERAKFSHHEVDRAMKDEAIDALEEIRGLLQAARDARIAAHAEGRAPAGSGA